MENSLDGTSPASAADPACVLGGNGGLVPLTAPPAGWQRINLTKPRRVKTSPMLGRNASNVKQPDNRTVTDDHISWRPFPLIFFVLDRGVYESGMSATWSSTSLPLKLFVSSGCSSKEEA